jgi:hypothetical protein
MVMIPTEYHDRVAKMGESQLHVEISVVYDLKEDLEHQKRSKK